MFSGGLQFYASMSEKRTSRDIDHTKDAFSDVNDEDSTNKNFRVFNKKKKKYRKLDQQKKESSQQA